MDTDKLAGLYGEARQIRDDTVRKLTAHAITQLTAVASALDDTEGGEEGSQADHLAKKAIAEVGAAESAVAELLASRDAAAEPAVAEAISAEAIAAEALAAEALAAETLAAEAVDAHHLARPRAVDAALQESAIQLAESQQTFAAEFNEITGKPS